MKENLKRKFKKESPLYLFCGILPENNEGENALNFFPKKRKVSSATTHLDMFQDQPLYVRHFETLFFQLKDLHFLEFDFPYQLQHSFTLNTFTITLWINQLKVVYKHRHNRFEIKLYMTIPTKKRFLFFHEIYENKGEAIELEEFPIVHAHLVNIVAFVDTLHQTECTRIPTKNEIRQHLRNLVNRELKN